MIAPIRQDPDTNGLTKTLFCQLTNFVGDTKEPPPKKLHTAPSLPSSNTTGNMLNPPKEYEDSPQEQSIVT